MNDMKLSPGDRVAVVSPSFAAPALFPAVHELALHRIRDVLGLEPVEFPTTRRHGASPADRAADLMAAWADPSIRAVFATIGGNDQITLLPYLDPEVFRADPKPFLGFSDNTNLLNWLWFHGIPGFHGGSTMVHLARGAGIDPEHLTSLRAALFEKTELEIRPLPEFCEEELGWDRPEALTQSPPSVPSPGWFWHQPDRVVTGPTWGGCLEILHANLAAGRWIHPAERYAGSVLLLETSEEMPSGDEVFTMVRNAGERGLLRQFPAVLVATAKGTALFDPRPPEQRAAYREEQRAAVLNAMAMYNPEAMVVFGVDFGHTAPQWVLPYGGRITVDGPARRIVADY
ncbi:muramoyltetrapeptide carboxypeptidase LdcA involved in peptidoglycan recycling [Actinoplanes xinjiangensis]|uniref:Muramoyltetrapeptide carboxypeptidase LdcA involved in peptidoglycan recycling n=2 Tax=Actinoplanes xinjiangensis TaxID=512350 RepID=A0A316EHX9_9ACTN|nr:muramoyltetrapeptide carboxypeptidase LdcA involved in peptidoglycan recycling [Actinoplanes xinjiangensis]GIF44913.1 LD-carboxypeptidase [Actinoplanes xinjiangensis]